MDSILFTQNKLEEVIAKKPDEKTLPRYFAEAGKRFKSRDYEKCLDYLKYVVDQSASMIKKIEELEKLKAELEEEEEVEAVVALADDEEAIISEDDDGEIKIEVVEAVEDVGEVRQLKVKGVKTKGKKKVKAKKKKAAKKKGEPAEKKAKTKKKASKKEVPKFTPAVKGTPPKFKPKESTDAPKFTPVGEKPPEKKKTKVKAKKKKPEEERPEVWEVTPPKKAPDLRLKALMSAQKAAEKFTQRKEAVKKAKEAGEDVAVREEELIIIDKKMGRARELLAQEKFEEMISVSSEVLELMK